MISGEMPAPIVNPVNGAHVVFQRSGEETGGELLVMEHGWSRPGFVIPRHRHPGSEESITVVSGAIELVVDGETVRAAAGDRVDIPAGTPHAFRDGGEGPALLHVEMRPALRWEDFLRQLFALAAEPLDDHAAERSLRELFSEFAPEIELLP